MLESYNLIIKENSEHFWKQDFTQNSAAYNDNDILNDQKRSGGFESRRLVDPVADGGTENDYCSASSESVDGHQSKERIYTNDCT